MTVLPGGMNGRGIRAMIKAVMPPDSADYVAASNAQARAADPGQSAWVSANAGSGKTKVLIDRVARLLLKKAKPDSILCVTYTKAAANEMLQRLFDRLGRWSVMAEEVLRVELGRLENRSPESYSAAETRAARALFARAVETPGGLRIETIHAFCARILRRFPIEAQLAPGFQEIDDIEAAGLWNEALQRGLGHIDSTAPEILDEMARYGGGAGALGGLRAARIAATPILEFAKIHSGDAERIEAALRDALGPPDKSEDALIAEAMGPAFPTADLQAACEALEADGKRESKRTAAATRLALASVDLRQRWMAYRGAFYGTSGAYKSLYNVGAKASDIVPRLFQTKELPHGSEVQRIEQLEADLKAARLFARSRALLRVSVPVLQVYDDLKRTRAAVDFDDLIKLTRDLLSTRAATEWILYKLDGGLTHVLLDEAQDTSPDQWALLNAITSEFFAGQGRERAQQPRTLFVVGDEKQSIYSFQGADPVRFLEERQAFQLKSLTAFETANLPDMAMSFRSSPEILTFVDQVSASGDVDGHPYLAGPPVDANIMRHTARRANQPGLVELWPIEVPEPLADPIPWDAPRDTQPFDAPKVRLAQKVAEEVYGLIRRGEAVWAERPDRRWERRAAGPGDILILVQKRTGGLFDALIDALKAKDIPVAGADRLVLADHIGVQDCLNLIRFVLLPEDDLTLAEILRGPFGGLLDDNEHLFALAHNRGQDSLWARLKASAVPAHCEIAAFLDRLLERRNLPAYEFLSWVLDVPDAQGITGWDKLGRRLGEPMRDPVTALLARAMAQDAQSAASLQAFVAQMDVDDAQIKRDLAAPSGQVRVMTVHGAKGLQASIVIMPDTTRAPKPQDPSIFNIAGAPVWVGPARDDTDAAAEARDALRERQLREHRRLLYVALTRAQDRLILCGAWSGARPAPDADPGDGYKSGCWYDLCWEAMDALVPPDSHE
ncbi:MAG: UvrD-helicase domain-containing protein, partial [Pseudomonadota bacterium]